MGVPENIDALLVKYDITQDSLARIAGVTPGAVTGWRKGSRPRKDAIKRICENFGLTEDDIISDVAGLAAKEHGTFSLPPNAIPVRGTSAMLPLLGHTHMGDAVDEDTCERMVEVPACVAERHPNGYCVHADGSCMDNRYTSDSILLVDPDMEPKNDDAVLAELPNYQSVVRVYMRGASALMLSPDSHSGEYEDIIVRPDDEPVLIKGVIVWHQAESDLER